MTGFLDDRQWRKITQRLQLPDEARASVEQEIVWYRQLDSTWRRAPSEVNKNLKRLSAAASKLAGLLEGLADQEKLELIEAWPPEPSLLNVGLGRIDAAIIRARAISIACENAQISKFSQTERVDLLIERTDAILLQFLGIGLSQGQDQMTFLVEIFKAAKIKLKERSIRLAVERFQANGKMRKENSSKSAADSRQ